MIIKVIGASGIGKTTIANLLHRVLKETDLKLELRDDSYKLLSGKDIKRNLKAMEEKKVSIAIETVTALRER